MLYFETRSTEIGKTFLYVVIFHYSVFLYSLSTVIVKISTTCVFTYTQNSMIFNQVKELAISKIFHTL